MREGMTKDIQLFAPEFGLPILQAVGLCDRVVRRRRSTANQSQIMYHNTLLRSARCVLVTNAVRLILNAKGQTSYWTFVQCLNAADLGMLAKWLGQA